MGTKVAAAVLAVLMSPLVSGCSSGFKKYECRVAPEALEPDPRAVWSCHRDIVRRAAHDKKFTLLEFREAVAFFERLTSIDAGEVQTDFGPIPTAELRRKLDQWDAWYERNRARLVWDDELGVVAVSG